MIDHHVFFSMPKEYKDTVIISETVGCGILDSGCSKTVCGVEWLEAYIDTLSEEEVKEVKFEPSISQFKFGNAQIYKSIHNVIFPAVIGFKKILIAADVLDIEIPLLLSKTAMKKANTVIDFHNDCVTMFGNKIKLLFTSTGHYCITLNKKVDIAYGRGDVSRVYFVNLIMVQLTFDI